MTTKEKLIEVSPTLFLNSLPTEKHAEVRALFDDANVDHIVLMLSKNGGGRQIIPIGRNSRYKKITDINLDMLEGMHPKAFVDARMALPDLSKKHSPRKHTPIAQPSKLQGLNDPQTIATSRPRHSKQSSLSNEALQKQIDELKHKLAEEQSKAILQEQTIQQLKQHIEPVNTYSEESSHTVEESLLIDREKSVAKAEEELINRLTYLMEKEAELEQFQEDLEHRERYLNEREEKDSTESV